MTGHEASLRARIYPGLIEGTVHIRPAAAGDAAAVAHIYNQGIEERQATFETQPRTPADFADAGAGGLPFLVAHVGDQVVGWARVLRYSDRDCYRGVGEASLYIDRAARGRGLGRRLLDALEGEAARRGHWKLVGLIFPENRGSVALCRACDYREVGLFERHGRLDGEWRDVLLMERLLSS